MTTTHRHAPSRCPLCFSRLDASAGLQEDWTPETAGLARNEPGDFTVCAYCGEMLRFRESLKLSVATDLDLVEAGEETRLALEKAQLAVQVINARIINRKPDG